MQQQEARNYLELFLGGLSEELLGFAFDAAKAECAARKKGKRAEPLALKAAVDKAFNDKASRKS